MPTISKMTPEDLTAIGVKKPNHRKKLKAEITKLNLPDGLPNFIPASLEEWLYLVRLMEYRGLFASQGYLTIDDLISISIEDFEDIGIYRLGHQKRLILAIKRAKDLKSGRRIAQYPPSNNNIVRPIQNGNCSRPPPSPASPLGGMSSFQSQPQHLSSSRTNLVQVTTKAIMEPFRPVYQPDVIRIERAPSASSMMRPPSCSPSPPPPPPPSSQPSSLNNEVIVGMPQPMSPLPSSFLRYQPLFQMQPPEQPQPPSWNGGMRSYDDVDIALSHRNQDRVLVHQISARDLTASGGTLPRLGKASGPYFNKLRPVAKIVAKTRESTQPQALGCNSLSDIDPKTSCSTFSSPLHHPLKQSSDRTQSDSHVSQTF
jgi:hypothetical protein